MFKNTINILKNKGHKCDIIITSKDVLEDLIINEGWEYQNIFPKGRKISNIPTKLSAFLNTFRTVYRLNNIIKNIKYDLFITDDLLVVNGWFKKTPTLLLQDDDLSVTPETALLFLFASRIISPTVSKMGIFNYKKISFLGYKELGGLHPNRFNPDYNVIKKFNPNKKKYYLIRLVSLKATHDVGKSGISNSDLKELIRKLELSGGNVYISSERNLPNEFEKNRINMNPNEIAHVIKFAEFIISDSQTMSAESAVLGTPYIRFNDFVGKISYLDEIENKFKLGMGIKTKEKNNLFRSVDFLLNFQNKRKIWNERKNAMLKEKIDLTGFLVWLFEDYDVKIKIFDNNNNIQKKFIFND